MALAIAPHLALIELGYVQSQIGMCRQAVVAAVHLRDRERYTLAGLHVQSLAQRAVQGHIAFEGSRAEANEAEQIGNHAELFLDCIEQWLGRGGSVVAAGNGEARHGLTPW